MMMSEAVYRCPACGHEYDAGLLFCGRCGTPNEPARRVRQIEQMLGNGAAGVPAPPSPASSPPPAAPVSYPPAPAASYGPPAPAGPGVPAAPAGITMQDLTARPVPDGPSPEAPAAPARDPNRLIRRIALIAAGVLLLLAVIGIARYAMQGYHASPERLFAGFKKAVREEDGELLLDLIQPELVEQRALDEDTVLSGMTGDVDIRYTLLDVMTGKKGNMAYLCVRIEYSTDASGTVSSDTMSSSFAYRPSSTTSTLLAIKQDGKWYLNFYGSLYPYF